MKRTEKFACIVAGILVPITAFMIVDYSGGEPFMFFRRSEAVYFVGGSYALLAIWALYSMWVVCRVIVRDIRWPLSLLLIPAVLMAPKLCQVAGGYLTDLGNYAVCTDRPVLKPVVKKDDRNVN